MRRSSLFFWLLVCTACVPHAGSTRLQVDLASLFALGTSSAAVTDVTLLVSANDIPDTLVLHANPNDLTLDADVPSGAKRRFDVSVSSDGNILAYGRAVQDMPSGGNTSLILAAYPAGTLQGSVGFATSEWVPDTYVLLATAIAPRETILAATVVPLRGGSYAAPLVAGTYELKLFDNKAMKGAAVLTGHAVVLPGQVIEADLLVPVPGQSAPKLIFAEQPAGSLAAGDILPVSLQVVDASNSIIADARLAVTLTLVESAVQAVSPIDSNTTGVVPIDANSTGVFSASAARPRRMASPIAPHDPPPAAAGDPTEDPNLALNGTLTVTSYHGVASFTDLLVRYVGSGYTLVASSPGLGSVESTAFSVTPGAATTLEVSITSPAMIGVSVTGAVSARDTYGNLAVNYSDSVHFTSTDLAATLPDDSLLQQGSLTLDGGFVFQTSGSQKVIVSGVAQPQVTGEAAVEVQ